MMRKVLHLGLSPPPSTLDRHIVHFPLIETRPLSCPFLSLLWPRFTHLLFTSQRAVQYLDLSFEGKTAIALGAGTAERIRERGVEPLIAPEPTQEGVIALLDKLIAPNTFWCLPQSSRSRPLLARFLKERNIPHLRFTLYETHLKKETAQPNLSEFNEVFFTSPSTVEAFFSLYREIPPSLQLTPIGPLTEERLLLYTKVKMG